MTLAPPACLGLRRSSQRLAGFSLVELLGVLAIIAILSSVALMAISGLKGSRELNKAAYDIQGILEQARTLAMASDTYTWVGFFRGIARRPRCRRHGQVVIAVVPRADGTKLYSALNPSSQMLLSAAGLTQAAKLLKIDNLHLDVLGAAAVPRPSVPAATYQVGSTSFASQCNFQYPPAAATPTYTFTRVIQFNPQGDATRIADSPTQVMEIGLRPAHGGTVATASADVAAIQIAGIGGHVTTYYP
ncbi:MAG: prepilin-type N-terminal cleavage/methylation domain-containing protein [Verrucomicrobiota bacterium]